MPVPIDELSHVLCLPLAEGPGAAVGLLAGSGARSEAAPLVVPVTVRVNAHTSIHSKYFIGVYPYKYLNESI